MPTYYQESEIFIADLLGLELQPGSGNQVGKKGDMRGIKVLVENKCTKTVTFLLSRPVMLKIAEEAMLDGRVPMLAYHSVHPELQGAWVMMPTVDYKEYEVWPPQPAPSESVTVVGETHRISIGWLRSIGEIAFLVQFLGVPPRYRWWRGFHIWEPESSRYERKRPLAEDFKNMIRKGEL